MPTFGVFFEEAVERTSRFAGNLRRHDGHVTSLQCGIFTLLQHIFESRVFNVLIGVVVDCG